MAYAQILAEGLSLGQTVRLAVHSQRLVLSDGENEYRPAPAVASTVFLEPIPAECAPTAGVISLADLKADQQRRSSLTSCQDLHAAAFLTWA
jgi:hypothetical protein